VGQDRYETLSAAVHALLGGGRSLEDVLGDVLRALGEGLGWDLAIAWRADPSGSAMRFARAWRRPDGPGAALVARSETCVFSPGVGLPGRVLARREPAWLEDVQVVPAFPRVAAAVEDGLHAGFGFPILDRHRVVGMIEFFCDEPRPPDGALLAMIDALGPAIGALAAREWDAP